MAQVEKKRKFFKITPTRFIVFGFLGLISVGAFLLCLPISSKDGSWLSFSDSIFTATSAVCVTGLATVSTAVHFSLFGQFVIMFLIQIGGIGFMGGALLLFLAIGKRITLSERMALQESFSHYQLQGVVKIVKQMLIYVAITELVGAILLSFSFIPQFGFWNGLFKSVFHSISAFCNAGFDLMGTAEAPFIGLSTYVGSVGICLPIIMLIIVGGLGFVVMKDMALSVRSKRLSTHAKIVLLISGVLILVAWAAFLGIEWNGAYKGLSSGDKVLAALFQAVTPRTAGFATVDPSQLSDASDVLTMALMFIGASPASTGGGIKTTTFFILCVLLFSTLKSEKFVNFHKRNISDVMIKKAVSMVFLGLALVFVSAFLILCIEGGVGNSQVTSGNVIFECFSAFSTVGLSKGITPDLSAASKIILCITMFVGRVGPLTLGAAIAKSAKNDMYIKYTDAKILIG